MSILTLIESSTSNIYRKKASTHGGEYSGPCPWCFGEDRFSIHPEQDHFVCRMCKKAGDSIKFVQEYHHKTYLEACQYLNIQPTFTPRSSLDPADPKHQQAIRWQPREIEYPSTTWQSRAEAILFESYKYLLSAAGRPHRDWLNARGINNETIKAARLGWNTASVHFDRESWDLDPEIDKTGKPKSVWIPAGLIIPFFHAGRPVRLRIRQENPISTDRYIVAPGSAMGFFDYTDHLAGGSSADMNRPAIITEAELDGWLLHQELGNSLRVYAVGNSSARPDKSAHEYINNHTLLINLDNDAAGIQEIPWWQKQYPKSIPWLSEFGKDPGESFEMGDNIRAWGLTGLAVLNEKFPTDLANPVTVVVDDPKIDHRQRIIDEYDARTRQQAAVVSEAVAEAVVEVDQDKAESYFLLNPTEIKLQVCCIHGLFCQTLKDNRCLITGTSPWLDLDRCPAQQEQWYKYQESESVELVIFSPGFDKNGKSKKK